MQCIDSSRRDDSACVALILPFFLSPLLSFSFCIYIFISIPHGVLFIVASRRYVPVRGSHATSNPWLHMRFEVVLRLPTPMSMRFAYLSIISPVFTIYFVILKIEFYEARKGCAERRFKLIPPSLEGISCAVYIKEWIRKPFSWTAWAAGGSWLIVHHICFFRKMLRGVVKCEIKYYYNIYE